MKRFLFGKYATLRVVWADSDLQWQGKTDSFIFNESWWFDAMWETETVCHAIKLKPVQLPAVVTWHTWIQGHLLANNFFSLCRE